MRRALVVAAVCTLAFTAAESADAQGLWLNGHLTMARGMEIREKNAREAFEWNSGFGAGLAVGWAFTPSFSIFLSADGTRQADEDEDAWGIGQADLGVRYTIVLPGISPYITAAYGARSFQYTEDGAKLELTGSMFSLGGGVQHFFSPKLALDVGALVGMGAMDEWSVQGAGIPNRSQKMENMASTTTTRLSVGLSWYPMRR